MKHIFLLNSELFLIVGNLPKLLLVDLFNGYNNDKSHEEYAIETNKRTLDEYHAKIEQLKKEAVKVGNFDFVRQMWWIQETPNEGISRADWFATKKEGEIYTLDCDVEIIDKEEGDEYMMAQFMSGGKLPIRKVAILKPKQEPVDTQNNDLWSEIFDALPESKQWGTIHISDLANAFDEVTPKFTITRK